MRILTITATLISCALLFSCASESKDDQNTTHEPLVLDTSMKDLVGVIEENPPVMNGDYVEKYDNGIVKMKGYYINGKRNGQWTGFFADGKLMSEGFFKDGLRDGKAIVYHQNGQVYYTGYYNNGREVGKWVFFAEDGRKVNEKDFGN